MEQYIGPRWRCGVPRLSKKNFRYYKRHIGEHIRSDVIHFITHQERYMLGNITIIFNNLDRRTLLPLYKALVRPIMEHLYARTLCALGIGELHRGPRRNAEPCCKFGRRLKGQEIPRDWDLSLPAPQLNDSGTTLFKFISSSSWKNSGQTIYYISQEFVCYYIYSYISI